VEYHLQVSDDEERAGYEPGLEDGQVSVTIDCSGCGYLKVGPALEALEQEAPGLGAAFYWMLTHALCRVMRVYNHYDALMYEEQMIECANEDEENRDQHEFPEVRNALPKCIQKTLKRDRKEWEIEDRQLLRRFRNGRYRSWIERLFRIQRLSRVRLNQSHDNLEGYCDSPPVPSLLIAFNERDAITACFDEEGQHMLEGNCEPTLYLVLSPKNSEEVRHALRVLGRFITLNFELFLLIEELQELC
jgi:hypothetical protein